MDFAVGASPTTDVILSRYEAALFPKFRTIFEESPSESLLQFLAQPPEEAERAIVLENRASKDVTALRYQWVMTGEDGKQRTHTVSSDSYMVDVYHPVLGVGDRKLICWSATVDESLIEHVLRGGGSMVGGVGSGRASLTGVTSLRLEIDMLLFSDGEIAGPDAEKFAAELQSRKPAAEFVAKQIRLAEAEGRDVTPVVSALAEFPCLGRLGHAQGDPLVHWTRHYAREYLHAMRRKSERIDMREARLRHFENRPTPPRFYRRDDIAQ
ncbi:MAG: hypothetical protein WB711_25370 [Terriglobales bacterium]